MDWNLRYGVGKTVDNTFLQHLIISVQYTWVWVFLQVTLSGQISSMQTIVDRLYMGCEFIDKLIRYAPATEALSFKKQINARIQELLAFQPDNTNSVSGSDLEFVSNYQVFCVLYPPTWLTQCLVVDELSEFSYFIYSFW